MNTSLQKLGDMALDWLEKFGPKLIGAGLIVAVGWWISDLLVRIMKRGLKRGKTDAGIITFLASLANALLKTVVCVTALAQLQINVASIITALGAAGVTAGLAMKDSMSNIASGAQILFSKPFHVGDYLAIENVEGTVERIEIMFTTLRTFDNKEVIVPNSQLTGNVITNYTAQETRRLDLSYSVSYNTNLAQARDVLMGLLKDNEMVLHEPAPLVAVGEHKDSCIQMAVKVWCKREDYWPLYYSMQEKVKNAFDEAQIEIPFPQLDIHKISA